MNILIADLHIPGWCSFRIPHSINAHLTYPAPPPTTVYGLLANALGMFQDDYSLLPELRIGLRILEPGMEAESYTRWMKWNPSKGSMTAMLIRQKLIRPAYRIYVAAGDEILNRLEQALLAPARILYLGESDDLVEIHGVRTVSAAHCESDVIDSVVPVNRIPRGLQPEVEVSVVHWPVMFERSARSSHAVRYGLSYVASQIRFAEPVPCLWLEESGDRILLEGEPSDVEIESQAVS